MRHDDVFEEDLWAADDARNLVVELDTCTYRSHSSAIHAKMLSLKGSMCCAVMAIAAFEHHLETEVIGLQARGLQDGSALLINSAKCALIDALGLPLHVG